MIKVTRDILIHRPVGEVFDYITHRERAIVFDQSLIEIDTGGKTGLGTKIREVRKFMGRRVELAGEIVEYEPNHVFGWKLESPHGPVVRGRVRLEPADGDTRVTFQFEMETRGVFRLGKPVAERMMRRDIATTQEHLKDVLEAHADLHETTQALPPHKHK